MSGRQMKLMKRYAVKRGIRYKWCKKIFKESPSKLKELYRQDMKNVI